MESPEVSQANAYMLEAATAAVKEVSSLGVDTAAANTQVSFDTVNQLNQRADMETFVFQDNLAIAMRRDGEIYASIVNDIYDVPRNVTMRLEDGTEKNVQVMNEVVDLQSGRKAVLNDIRGRYDTYTDVGPSFQSMKEQNRSEIADLLQKVPPQHQAWNILLLQYLTMMDGKGVDITREFANKQLITGGFKKPETEEEQMWLMEAMQSSQNQQDPAMVLAMAEQGKAQAEQMSAQARLISAQTEAERRQNAAQAEMIKAQTEIKNTEIKAFTANQDALESQANTVLKLTQADNLKQQRVIDAIEVLKKAFESTEFLPSGIAAESFNQQSR